MKKFHKHLYALLLLPVLLSGLGLSAREVPNFNLLDVHDKNHELFGAKGKAVVLFFTGSGCPVARKGVGKIKALEQTYAAEGVNFWIVNSYADESKEDIRKEINKLGLGQMIYLLDSMQLVALSYGVNRTAEIVAIDTFSLEVFYQGALDDQFGEDAERPEAT